MKSFRNLVAELRNLWIHAIIKFNAIQFLTIIRPWVRFSVLYFFSENLNLKETAKLVMQGGIKQKMYDFKYLFGKFQLKKFLK